jgi:hypothetical protein
MSGGLVRVALIGPIGLCCVVGCSTSPPVGRSSTEPSPHQPTKDVAQHIPRSSVQVALKRNSSKGWICKTHEGELAISIVPGVTPTIWYFSVRDESVMPQLNAALGKRVVLHYREHRGLPTNCFGETNYFVTDVRVAE